jgi:hypothetical protein
MADLKISQLTAVSTPVAGTEVLPVVQSGATKKATIAQLKPGFTRHSRIFRWLNYHTVHAAKRKQ